MKNTRRLASILLALVMVFAMAATAFADETTATDNSITVTGEAGHTYEVYQIFTGDLSGNVLSNIVWGNGVSEAGRTALGNAAALAAGLTDANMKAFQADVDPYLVNPAVMAANGGTYTLTNLAAGYYLVKDKDGTQEEENGAYTAYIIRVVGAVSVTPKVSVPTVDKSVTAQGTNADDFNIGDTVTFILRATLGQELDEYNTYKVVFHDTLSAGLNYSAITSVVVNGKTLTAADYTAAHTDGQLTITIDDVLDYGAVAGSNIVVTYTAVLDSDAVVGTAGNPNTVYLEYSNDPNWDADGDGKPDNSTETEEPTGNTPVDTVLVFTYTLGVTKVDGAATSTTLPGAQFVLLNSEGDKVAKVVDGKFAGWVDIPADNNWAANSILTSDTNGVFQVAGLDAGTYMLREIKAPAGYNLLTADVEIVIAAALNTDEDVAALTSLTIAVNNGTPVDGTAGVVNATVENNKGATLPSTGGMGTTILYVVGGILVLAAVVLLVTKKRMNVA